MCVALHKRGEPFCDALRALLEMIYSGEERVTVKLKEGA